MKRIYIITAAAAAMLAACTSEQEALFESAPIDATLAESAPDPSSAYDYLMHHFATLNEDGTLQRRSSNYYQLDESDSTALFTRVTSVQASRQAFLQLLPADMRSQVLVNEDSTQMSVAMGSDPRALTYSEANSDKNTLAHVILPANEDYQHIATSLTMVSHLPSVAADNQDMVGRYYQKKIDLIFFRSALIGNNFTYSSMNPSGSGISQEEIKYYKKGVYMKLSRKVNMLCYSVKDNVAHYAYIPPVAQWDGIGKMLSTENEYNDKKRYFLVSQIQPWIFYEPEQHKNPYDVEVEDKCYKALPTQEQVVCFADALSESGVDLAHKIYERNQNIFFIENLPENWDSYYKGEMLFRHTTEYPQALISYRYVHGNALINLTNDDDPKRVMRTLTQSFVYHVADGLNSRDDVSYFIQPPYFRWGVYFYGNDRAFENGRDNLLKDTSIHPDEIAPLYNDALQYDKHQYNWTKVHHYLHSFATRSLYGRDGNSDLVELSFEDGEDDWVIINNAPYMWIYRPDSNNGFIGKGRDLRDHSHYPLRVVYLLDENL